MRVLTRYKRYLSDVANVIKKLAPRWFLLRDAHAREGMMLLQPRWAMTLMLGPMTRTEIKRARELAQGRGEKPEASRAAGAGSPAGRETNENSTKGETEHATSER